MARFERDGELFEVWLESGPGSWRVFSRESDGRGQVPPPIEELATRYQFAADGYCELQAHHLRDGWRRVRDPAREVDVDGEPREPALDARMLADPGDADAALVYADWLQQRGHARGALIAVQHARRSAATPALAAEERRLLVDHADELLGPLAQYPSGTGDPHVALEWELGFVRRARIAGFFDDGESEDLLWEVLRHPSCRYLRELELGVHHPGNQDNVLMADLLLHAGPTPPLRRLVLADFDNATIDDVELSRSALGDLTGLGTRYPLLEEVELKGTGDVVLRDLALPRARRFALRTSSLRRTTLASILAAPWPELVELELWIGDEDHGGDVEPVDLDPLFAIGRFPKLRTLRLMNAMFTDEICARVAAWPHARVLETLDVSLGTMSDVGAALLVGAREQLGALRVLNIAECCLTPGGISGLETAGFPIEQRAAFAAGTREPLQKSERYVSVRA